MYHFNQSPELTEAESALLSLYREIRRHPEHKRLHVKMTGLRVRENQEARNPSADALVKMKKYREEIETLEAEQLAFIRREFGTRIDAAKAAITAAGGDANTMILR